MRQKQQASSRRFFKPSKRKHTTMQEETLYESIQNILASREEEKKHLRELTARLLYEERERREVRDFFVQRYKGMVRGAYIRGNEMYLLMKEEQRPGEIVAVGEVPERYKGKIPFSVILPSAYYY